MVRQTILVMTLLMVIVLASAACVASETMQGGRSEEGDTVNTAQDDPVAPSPVTVVRFMANGNGLLSGHADGSLSIHGPASPEMVLPNIHDGPVIELAVSPQGTYAASIGEDRKTLLHEFDGDILNRSATVELATSLTPPNSLDFSPDGAFLAEAYWEKLAIWAADSTDEVVLEIDGLEPSIRVARYSPNGSVLSLSLANTGLAQPAILHLDPASGEVIGNVIPPTPAEELVYAPDGTRFAAVLQDSVSIWRSDATTAEQTLMLENVRGLAFAPDGATLYAATQAGNDLEITAWDVQSGEALSTLRQSVTGEASAAFAPDLSAVAIGNSDGSVIQIQLDQ